MSPGNSSKRSLLVAGPAKKSLFCFITFNIQGAHFLTEDEAQRIFKGVDRDNDEKFTLEDLKKEANKYVAIETGVP